MDIVTVFAVLLRRILFDDVSNDEQWLRKLRNAGFPKEDVKAIYEEVCSHVWLHNCLNEEDKFNMKVAASFYKHTWFSQDSVPGVVSTNMGCMAGMPLADIIYGGAFARLLKILRDTIFVSGLVSVLTTFSGEEVPVFEVSFCDDTAIPCLCDAGDVVSKTLKITEVGIVFSKCLGWV